MLLPTAGYLYRESIAKAANHLAATLPLPHLPQGAAAPSPAKQAAQTAQSLLTGLQKAVLAGVSLLGMLGLGVLALKGGNALNGAEINRVRRERELEETQRWNELQEAQAQKGDPYLKPLAATEEEQGKIVGELIEHAYAQAAQKGHTVEGRIEETKKFLENKNVQALLTEVFCSERQNHIIYEFLEDANIQYQLMLNNVDEYNALRSMYSSGNIQTLSANEHTGNDTQHCPLPPDLRKMFRHEMLTGDNGAGAIKVLGERFVRV